MGSLDFQSPPGQAVPQGLLLLPVMLLLVMGRVVTAARSAFMAKLFMKVAHLSPSLSSGNTANKNSPRVAQETWVKKQELGEYSGIARRL